MEREDEENEDEGAQLSDTVPDLIKDEDMPKILYGVLATREVPWPADPDKTVFLRALTREQIFDGISEASQYIEEKGLTGQVYETYVTDDGKRKEVTCLDMATRDEWIAMAVFKDKALTKPVFDNARDLRRKLTSQEINRLYEWLAEHMQSVTPLTHAEAMGKSAMYAQLIEELKKKPGLISLDSMPRDILADLVRFMILKFCP